jgi:heptosyltransferase-2
MKILAIQNRMGIGDMVIFLPFIEAISKKFNSPVSILVKENSKALEYLEKNKCIEKILILERNNNNSHHDGIIGSFNLAKDLKKYSFDKVFIFNSSLRFHLICKIAGIKEIFQYPLLQKKEQHLIKTAQNFIKKELDMDIDSNPTIELENSLIEDAKNKYTINSNQINILLGIGGSGPTKRIPTYKFLSFMKMAIKKYNCKFFLATGTNEEEQIILNEILNSEFKEKCVPLDKIKIKETLPIIKNCTVAICNDSSFSHLSAALDIPTIVLLSDTPLMYGSYSPNMYPIIPDGEETVTHDTLGKERINPEKIFKIFEEIVT